MLSSDEVSFLFVVACNKTMLYKKLYLAPLSVFSSVDTLVLVCVDVSVVSVLSTLFFTLRKYFQIA